MSLRRLVIGMRIPNRVLVRVAVARATGQQIEAIAEARAVCRSRCIREAVKMFVGTIDGEAIARRNAGIERQRDRWRHLGIKIGPVMVETIRAQSKATGASVSAIVEACCLAYVERSLTQ